MITFWFDRIKLRSDFRALILALFFGATMSAHSTESPNTAESNSNPEQTIANLDLDGLLEFARKNSPLYLSASKNISIAEAESITAGLLPNPTLSYNQAFIGGTPNSEAGSTEYAPGLSWELDWAGKRSQRRAVAEKGIAIEKFQYINFDRLFTLRLKQAYRQYLLLKETLTFKTEFLKNYLILLNASKIRFEKGDLSGIEYDRLDLDRISYEADRENSEIALLEVSNLLRRYLSIPPKSVPLELTGKLIFVPVSELGLPDEKSPLEQRPDLASVLTSMEQTSDQISLRRREALPSLSIGTEYRKKGNEGYFGITASLPLPFFDRRQGEILKAEETMTKLDLEAQSKRLEIQSEIQLRLTSLRLRERLLERYKEMNLLEKNKSVAERSRFAYMKKAYSIVGLIESQRNYLNVQKNYFEQLYSYYVSVDELRASIGENKPSVPAGN